MRREERRDSDVFQPLPFHYIELAQLLLRDAPLARETFGGGANYLQVSSLVEDIRQIRRNKIKAGLQNLKEYTPAVKVRSYHERKSARESSRARAHVPSMHVCVRVYFELADIEGVRVCVPDDLCAMVPDASSSHVPCVLLHPHHYRQLNNLSAMEVNQIRDFLSGALDTYHVLDEAELNSNETASQVNPTNASSMGTRNETQTVPRQLRR